MPQFGRIGDLHTVAYITGPQHVWLGLELSREPDAAPVIVERASIGSCDHGGIAVDHLVIAVRRGLGESGLYATRIEYIANDSPAYHLYETCARLLASRFEESSA